MSINVISLVWERYPEGGAKLLAMLALADWAGDDGGRIYPSMATLAAKIRMSERQTIRLVHDLVENNYLELLTPQNRGGHQKTNRYRMKLETLTNCQSIESKTLTNRATTLTNDTNNPDIAMSEEPLEPLKPLKAPIPKNRVIPGNVRPVSYGWTIPENPEVTLQKHIDHLKTLPQSDIVKAEIQRASKELDEIAPHRRQADIPI